MSDPAIALTQAARNGHIVAVDNRVFLPMSPYTSTLVQLIAEAIWIPQDKRRQTLSAIAQGNVG
jgi:ABC-type hemin transport system substrate-binding protein